MNKTVSPSSVFLSLVREQLATIRRQLPSMIKLGEKMAGRLLAGGRIWPLPIAEYWRGEFIGRAGGLMSIFDTKHVPQGEAETFYFALPKRPGYEVSKDELLQKVLTESKASMVLLGTPAEVKRLGGVGKRLVGCTGGVSADAGLFPDASGQPLAPLWPLEQFVRGWVTAGEMIAACTRAGKMPVIWMSIWLEGARVRNAYFHTADNLREVWHVPMFHDAWYVPPLAEGYAGGAFLDELERIVGVVESQQAAVVKAGQWMASAKSAGKTAHVVMVGHSYPTLLELDHRPGYPVTFGRTNSNLATAVPETLGPGDVAVHLGYAPVDVGDVQRILDRGVRFVYTSPYGRPAGLKNHKNLLWLDLPWRPADATVDVPGYSVRILPMSSSAQTVLYYSLLSEMLG